MCAARIHDAIRRGLADAARGYERRRIHVVRELHATSRLTTSPAVLETALATIFRGLPDRLAPGSQLRIRTEDRAGGDVELVWEAEEVERGSEDEHPLARDARAGELFDLAIQGLTRFCHARTAHVDLGGGRRRYSFLIPTLDRSAGWRPSP